MLLPAELREMQALVTRIQKGSVARRDWATLCAYALIYQGDATITAIAEGGYAHFKRVCAPYYAGHAFHESDLKRIYKRITDAARRAAPRVS